MSVADPNPYDLVDYPGHPFPDTHPARSGAIGVLRGMSPAPLARCRVLELGCGDAANLIPMACALPDARFTGVDLAAAPIRRGRQRCDALGLHNVVLHDMDILDLSADCGTFDYIIAHGLYSWVPENVRDRILDICARHLAPHGIAVVSYLAMPGNRVRDVLRDFLFAGGAATGSAPARVARARRLMRMFSAAPESPEPFQAFARAIAVEFDDLDDGTIFHDWLAPINAAMYVTDFVDHAASHGLQFLGEAQYFMSRFEHDPLLAPARDELARLDDANVVQKELMLDFLRCRRFRQTLLCHADVPLSPPSPARVSHLAVASHLSPAQSTGDDGVAEFRSPRGVSIRIQHPVLEAALRHLAELWPAHIAVAELLDVARAAAPPTGADPARRDDDDAALGHLLLACFGAAHADLLLQPPAFALSPGDRPRASALAREQLRTAEHVTSLNHRVVHLEDPLGRALLSLLDGTRDRDAIVDALARAIAAGELPAPTAPGDLRTALVQGLDASLHGLARSALLES